jgi:hypothetical protein
MFCFLKSKKRFQFQYILHNSPLMGGWYGSERLIVGLNFSLRCEPNIIQLLRRKTLKMRIEK